MPEQLTLGPAYIRQIPSIASLSDEALVTVQNSSDAIYCLDLDRRRWIRKYVTCNGLLAEALCWLLARRLRVPVPDGAVFFDRSNGNSWLSACIPNIDHWSQESYHLIDNRNDIGRMLALDTIVLNEDRHSGNILLQAQPDSSHLIAWSIDMANALIGEPRDYGARKHSLPTTTNLAPGLPIELLHDAAMATAADAESISEMELSGFILEACVLAQEPDPSASQQLLLPTLRERCKLASRLVADYLASIDGGR